MNKINQNERIASERLSRLESPARRLLIKGMAGLGATLVSSSLSAAIAAQTQSHQPGAPGNQVPPDQVGWGPFTPSSGEGRYLQVVYPPSTTKGELQIGATYTLWIPDNIKTVRAVVVHQHGASIPAAQAGATSAYDLHWQALAKRWSCVLLEPSYVLMELTQLQGRRAVTAHPRQRPPAFLPLYTECDTMTAKPEVDEIRLSPVLFLLALSVFINYLDRGNLSIAAPLLKNEFQLSATQLGVLLSSFFWTYSFFLLLSGWLVDRLDVKWVIAGGFFLWSAATAATGAVHAFSTLLLARLARGAGESGSHPACAA